MRRVAAALALGFSLVALAPEAPAEPSLWYRASHPQARAEARLLRAIERMLDGEARAAADPEVASHFARSAVAMFDLARAPSPEDPRLACAVARALIGSNLGRIGEAQALLEGAIPKLPESTLLVTAWHDLGRARALAGDFPGARAAQSRVLELAVEPREWGLAFYDRAGAELRLGENTSAALDFRRAAEDAPTELVRLRARFGLAMALERSGDLPGAWAALEHAVAMRLPLSQYTSDDPLELPGAFDPPYELEYVKALAALARARRTTEREERGAALEEALRRWDAYLETAPPSEPWLANARRHREETAAELRKIRGARPHASR
jgi:tetratricopeptide (TPR) repeat protein